MANSRKHLAYFLGTYLSVSDGSLAEAVGEFAQGEPERVASFIQELGFILDGDVDPLRALIRERGNYYLPDGVSPRDLLVPLHEELQRWHARGPYARTFAVVIRYNHVDRQAATAMYSQLKAFGFNVRMDEWGQPAHTAVSGFHSSDVVLVVISRSSAQSISLQTDLLSALRAAPTRVVAVRLDPSELPVPLQGFRHVDLLPDLQSGVRLLMRDLEFLRAGRRAGSDAYDDQYGNSLPSWAESFYQRAEAACQVWGWPPSEAYKDVVVARLTTDGDPISEFSHLDLVDSCRVQLANWVGDSFPMDRYPSTRFLSTPTGYRMANVLQGLVCDWTFSFLEVDERGLLFQRTSIDEDHLEECKQFTTGVLGVEWLIKDVCTRLMFAQRVAINVGAPEVMVWMRWNGLSGRRLQMLHGDTDLLLQDYTAGEDQFTKTVAVAPSSNLQSIAAVVVEEALGLFQWSAYPKEVVAGHIDQILKGSFGPQ